MKFGGIFRFLFIKHQVLGKGIDYDAGCYAYVHGMLGAKLWYFQTSVTTVDYFLVNAFNFVAHHYGIMLVGLRLKTM